MTSGAEIPGALRGVPPIPISPEIFDEEHAATGRSEVIWRLAADAYGEDYPTEVRPWGLTTWWVLGRCVSALRVGPGDVVVDLACGRGGPGLWLSRATGADLIGVDWSPVAIEEATERTRAFVPSDRARFLVGDLSASGLPGECADAVVCLDAIFFAEDRIAALREVKRILRPAGRYVFTGPETDTPTTAGPCPGLDAAARRRRPRARKQGRGAALRRTAQPRVRALARTPGRDPSRDRRDGSGTTRRRGSDGRPDTRDSPEHFHHRTPGSRSFALGPRWTGAALTRHRLLAWGQCGLSLPVAPRHWLSPRPAFRSTAQELPHEHPTYDVSTAREDQGPEAILRLVDSAGSSGARGGDWVLCIVV